MFAFIKEKPHSLRIGIEVSRFDISTVKDFKSRLHEEINSSIKDVEVDFSGVDFIDSSGIGALLSIQKQLPSDGEPVTLINPKPPIVSVLELLRLHRVFRIRKE